MGQSSNLFGVPNEDIEACLWCGEQVVAGELDDDLCGDCVGLDLMQCTNCGELFAIEDMIDDDCALCIASFRR